MKGSSIVETPLGVRPRLRAEPGSRPDAAARTTRWLVVALVGLALLRLWGLDRWGLWIDEAFTLHDARALSWSSVTDFPLNLFLTSLWLRLVDGPPSEAVLRTLPCLFGILGIVATWWAFEPLLGRRRALVAALLVALSSYHLFWCQSARHYTLAQTLSLVGAGLALRGLARGRPSGFLAGLSLATMASFAHPSAALVVPALLVAPWLCARAGVPLAWSPSSRWIGGATLVGLALAALWGSDVWNEYASKKGGSSVVHLALTSGFYYGPPLALAALLGTLDAWRRRDRALVASTVFTLAFGAALLASLFAKVAAQYVFVMLPWAAAAASSIVLPQERRGSFVRAITVLVLAWGAADVALYLTTRHGDRPRWKEAYALVARSRGPDDLVYGMAAPVGEYYLDPGTSTPRATVHLAPLTNYDDRRIDTWARRERRVWIVLNREMFGDWTKAQRERFERFLRDQCERVRTFPVGLTPRDLDVEVYLRP